MILFLKGTKILFSFLFWFRVNYFSAIRMRGENSERSPVFFFFYSPLFVHSFYCHNQWWKNPHRAKTEQKRRRVGFREKIGGRELGELKSPIKKKKRKHNTVFLADCACRAVCLFLLFKRWALGLVLCHFSRETVAFSRFINQ